MAIALWIIALCEVIRAAQNMVQIAMVKRDTGARDNCYAEFVKSLKQDDREMVKQLLKEFEKTDDNPVVGVKLNLDGSWTEVRKNDEENQE